MGEPWFPPRPCAREPRRRQVEAARDHVCVARMRPRRNACARSRARGARGRSGGSRPRARSRSTGSRAGRAGASPRAATSGKSASRLTSSRSSAASTGGRRRPRPRLARVAEDAGDPRVRVLDVVDGVLLRLLGGEVDVDLDRLVGAAVTRYQRAASTPTSSDELVEEDDVAPPLRHLRRSPPRSGGRAGRAAPRRARGRAPSMRATAAYQFRAAVVVGAEHVERAVEAALELVVRGRRRPPRGR